MDKEIFDYFNDVLLKTKYPTWDGETYFFNEEYNEMQPKIIWVKKNVKKTKNNNDTNNLRY